MFTRIIQTTAICLFMTSLVVFADTETYDSAKTIEVVEQTESIEEVMPEPTHVQVIKDVVSSAYEVEKVEPESEIVEEPVEEIVEPEITMSDEDISLIALVTMAEAEGESELGKRLVIDVILNRLDSEKHPNTVEGVIYAPGQWASMWNGRVDACYVRDDIYQLVVEELISRTNSEVFFFRTKHYHTFGTPLFQEGNHYFSGY